MIRILTATTGNNHKTLLHKILRVLFINMLSLSQYSKIYRRYFVANIKLRYMLTGDMFID